MAADLSSILKAALADPFVFPEDDFGSAAIFKWYELAMREAPLWCFNARAFRQLNQPPPFIWEGSEEDRDGYLKAYQRFLTDRGQEFNNPSTHPLRTIIDRVLADEELDRSTLGMAGKPVRNLLARRTDLSKGDPHPAACYVVDNRIRTESLGLFGHIHELPDEIDGDWEGPIGSFSPYEELGRELASFVEGLQSAKGKEERKARRNEVDEFLESVGARLPPKRPAKGAPEETVIKLFTQGKTLVKTAWSCVPAEPSARAKDLLAMLPPYEHAIWCSRLAMPFLSLREIDALISQVQASRRAIGRRPSPRRFVVWCLSHRLGVEVDRLTHRIILVA